MLRWNPDGVTKLGAGAETHCASGHSIILPEYLDQPWSADSQHFTRPVPSDREQWGVTRRAFSRLV